MGLLDGRVVIVTGGGRGLGRAHCFELARLGATVVVNDLGVGDDLGPAAEVVAEIESAGGRAVPDTTSVTDFAGVGRLVTRTVADLGRLDAIVNNAGILRDRLIAAMEEAEFDLVVGVHLKGTFNLTRHACAHWKAEAKAGRQGTGRVVNTTSGSGLFGNIGQANYGAAKAAIASLTTITAMEMERYGVTANAVSPVARTRMTEALPVMQRAEAAGWDRYDPANTSPVVAWLCSEEAGWLSGAVLRVEGNAVQRLRPWEVDASSTFRGSPGCAVDAATVGRGLRTAFGAFPTGLPAPVGG